ncbi:multidrug ABC transporter ATP-binding protein [Microtetraspora sp. NBRC 13810]|uniref:ABC transporter ATP-binding protein n=1 Tax=Microtetraspora sp. NBRC 13810 TaxID=3030990 RepID=UPI00249FF5C3|nr:ABC transporter ATP-binding protein [Microtetraspora sp. NBRC 13810]GLW13007.1 multidrug ABC transporter ATP-binding protein [Microtetraspora sp. NBRC 13810]
MTISAQRGDGTAAQAVTTWDTARFMAARLRPYRGHTALALLIVLLRVGLGVLNPLALLVLLDRALPQRDTELLLLLCGGLVVLGGVASALNVAEAAITNWISQRLVVDLRTEVFDRAHAQPLEFFAARSASELQARLVSDVNGVDRFFSQTVRSVVAAIAHAATAAVAMVVLSWPLAVASLLLTTLLSLLNNRFARRRRSLAAERQRHITTMMRHVSDALSLNGTVLGRTLGRTDRQRDQFTGVCESISDTTIQQRVIGARTLTFIGFCFAAIAPIIYLVAGLYLPELSVGTLVALVMLQMRLSDPMQTLLAFSAQIQASVATFERIMEYTNLPAHPLPPVRKAAGGPPAARVRGLRFQYAGANRPALDGIDLDLAPGELHLVVGRTGSGKSTLGSLLAGLLRPADGVVTVDGLPAGPESLLEQATLVPQQTSFLNATLRENLEFAGDDVPEAEMARALRAACLDDLVASLPDGLDTPIGEGGHQLSGGERQRLAIARALLAGGRLFIFDEATSALDGMTAQRVHDAVRSAYRHHTLVVIAHRLPRLAAEDRVLVLDRGRIAEHGTHEELRSAGGAYAAMLAAQEAPAGGGRMPSRTGENTLNQEEEIDGGRRNPAGSRSGTRIPLTAARSDS